MSRAAVLGSPIEHSLSPVLHRAAYAALGLDWTYEAIECREDQLEELLGQTWAGLSLTMPLKRAVLPLLDDVSELARAVGGANTVVFKDGRRLGFNTDVHGMVAALGRGRDPHTRLRGRARRGRDRLLGPGGAARTRPAEGRGGGPRPGPGRRGGRRGGPPRRRRDGARLRRPVPRHRPGDLHAARPAPPTCTRRRSRGPPERSWTSCTPRGRPRPPRPYAPPGARRRTATRCSCTRRHARSRS